MYTRIEIVPEGPKQIHWNRIQYWSHSIYMIIFPTKNTHIQSCGRTSSSKNIKLLHNLATPLICYIKCGRVRSIIFFLFGRIQPYKRTYNMIFILKMLIISYKRDTIWHGWVYAIYLDGSNICIYTYIWTCILVS